jgi:DNA-binding GntR family transcriptional regulator
LLNNPGIEPSLPALPALAPLPTAAERAAGLIRDYIFQGRFLPGTPLPESSLAQALQVSRNTVREAFRMLMNEHLLDYEPHKGVTVRWLTPAEVREIFALRRLFELSAADLISSGTATADLAALDRTVADGHAAAAEGRWAQVGTANLYFHAALVAAHGNSRLDEFFRHLMTELRLGFLAVPDPESFHGPFLHRNAEIRDLLAAGAWPQASTALARYLDDAEGPVTAAVAAVSRHGTGHDHGSKAVTITAFDP